MIQIDGKLVPKDKIRKALRLYDDLLIGKITEAIREEIKND